MPEVGSPLDIIERAREDVALFEDPLPWLLKPCTAEEVGRVSPGERYPLIEEDQRSGWYKIEYKEGVSGWISNQYAKKIKESITPEPTISISPTSLLKPTEP